MLPSTGETVKVRCVVVFFHSRKLYEKGLYTSFRGRSMTQCKASLSKSATNSNDKIHQNQGTGTVLAVTHTHPHTHPHLHI